MYEKYQFYDLFLNFILSTTHISPGTKLFLIWEFFLQSYRKHTFSFQMCTSIYVLTFLNFRFHHILHSISLFYEINCQFLVKITTFGKSHLTLKIINYVQWSFFYWFIFNAGQKYFR